MPNLTRKKDEEVYEQLFTKNRKLFGFIVCEECLTPITKRFRDEKGKITCRFAFSHILSKGAFPEFRHNLDNFNILCMDCHNRWEFRDKKNMKIYAKNKEKWNNYLE
jgi:5-methylcytosine-specific restriction endonuclease McrA